MLRHADASDHRLRPRPRRRDGPPARPGQPRAGGRGRHHGGRQPDAREGHGERASRCSTSPAAPTSRSPRAPTARCCTPPARRDEVHGETGLDGPDLPPPCASREPIHAVELLAQKLRERPLTLIPIGPLTNIALLLAHPPRAARADRADRADGRRLRPRQRHPERRVQHLVRPGGRLPRLHLRASTSRWSASTSPTARCSAPPAPRRCVRRVTQAPSSPTCTPSTGGSTSRSMGMTTPQCTMPSPSPT